MPSCHEMEPNEEYVCASCGFEIVVQKGCTCEPDCSDCSPSEFSCCDQPMAKKEG